MARTAVTWTTTFLLVGAAGALTWLTNRRGPPEWLVGPWIGDVLVESFLYPYFGLHSCMIVAGVAGFVVWRGFWLWGFAAGLPIPPVEAFLDYRQFERGFLEVPELWTLIGFSFVVCLMFIMGCFLSSALGAGLRLASRRLANRPVPENPEPGA